MIANRTGLREDINPVRRSSILVLGVGNILLSDEGVGVHVIEAMKEMELPEDVELLDGGTGAFDLIDIIAGREKVIIIDAVEGGCEPGAVYRFSPDDIQTQQYQIASSHQVGLLDALAMTKILGCPPCHVIIYGIEPKRLDCGMELSPEIAASIPGAAELIVNKLKDGH
jgi:hydrogenase maturation protease